MTFGDAVRVIRHRQGLTQAQLAARAGIVRQTLVKIERAPHGPSDNAYKRIVGALGFALGGDLLVAAGAREALPPPPRPRVSKSSPEELERLIARSKRIVQEQARRRPAFARRQRLASATARGYGREHKRLRMFILLRDPWCPGVPEGIHGKELVRTTVMDHIVSLRNGGTTAQGCRGLCRSCNARKAVLHEGAGYMRGRGRPR